MVSSPFETARALGIRLDSYRYGEHRALCPKCSHLRKTVHRKIKCLAVKIDSDMLIWHCHHCGDDGGKRHDAVEPRHRIYNRGRSIREAFR